MTLLKIIKLLIKNLNKRSLTGKKYLNLFNKTHYKSIVCNNLNK